VKSQVSSDDTNDQALIEDELIAQSNLVHKRTTISLFEVYTLKQMDVSFIEMMTLCMKNKFVSRKFNRIQSA